MIQMYTEESILWKICLGLHIGNFVCVRIIIAIIVLVVPCTHETTRSLN